MQQDPELIHSEKSIKHLQSNIKNQEVANLTDGCFGILF